jgi:hypothetical protein
MKTFTQVTEADLQENLASTLFKAARLAADANAIGQAVKKKSGKPIERRIARKILGRTLGKGLFRLI